MGFVSFFLNMALNGAAQVRNDALGCSDQTERSRANVDTTQMRTETVLRYQLKHSSKRYYSRVGRKMYRGTCDWRQ